MYAKLDLAATQILEHAGPIPGVPVGSWWPYRMQVSEAGDSRLLVNLPVLGVHRPPVGGIHATTECAWSISMKTGGYEDDEDGGEEFVYTGTNFRLLCTHSSAGSGGKDLKVGNKRVGDQNWIKS